MELTTDSTVTPQVPKWRSLHVMKNVLELAQSMLHAWEWGVGVLLNKGRLRGHVLKLEVINRNEDMNIEHSIGSWRQSKHKSITRCDANLLFGTGIPPNPMQSCLTEAKNHFFHSEEPHTNAAWAKFSKNVMWLLTPWLSLLPTFQFSGFPYN